MLAGWQNLRPADRTGSVFLRICGGLAIACLDGMPIQSYRDLVVWQKAMSLAAEVYTVGRGFPHHDRSTLGNQLQRSAISTPSNIAEGWARGHGRTYIFHLRVALGSEAELQTQLELAERIGIVNPATTQALLEDAAEVGRMLRALVAALNRRGE